MVATEINLAERRNLSATSEGPSPCELQSHFVEIKFAPKCDGYRYYDPSIGRYISADPIGQAGGVNLFTYAQSDPINATDSLGLIAGVDDVVAVVLAGLAAGVVDDVKEHWADSKVREAIATRDGGDLERAATALRAVVLEAPDCVFAMLVLGDILWDQEKLDEALRCFESASQVAPTLEMASQGIFHIRLKKGDKHGAFQEIARFLKIADSQEYQRLLYELKHSKD